MPVTKEEMHKRMLEVRPEIIALGSAIRGVGVGIPLEEGRSPIIFVDVAFQKRDVVERIHEILRDYPHKVFDITRIDDTKEV